MSNVLGYSVLIICIAVNMGVAAQTNHDDLEQAIKSIGATNLELRESAQEIVDELVLSIPLKYWISMNDDAYSKILQRHDSEIQRHLESEDENIRAIAIGLTARLRNGDKNIANNLINAVIGDPATDNRLVAFEALCFVREEKEAILNKQVVGSLLESGGLRLEGITSSNITGSYITGLVIFSDGIADLLIASGHTKSELDFLLELCKPDRDLATCLFSLVVLQRFGVEAGEIAEKLIANSNSGDKFLDREIARTALLISSNPRILEVTKFKDSEKAQLLQDLANRIEEIKLRDIEFVSSATSMPSEASVIEWQLTRGFQVEKRKALRILMLQEARGLRIRLQDAIRSCLTNNDNETVRLANRVILELERQKKERPKGAGRQSTVMVKFEQETKVQEEEKVSATVLEKVNDKTKYFVKKTQDSWWPAPKPPRFSWHDDGVQ